MDGDGETGRRMVVVSVFGRDTPVRLDDPGDGATEPWEPPKPYPDEGGTSD